MKKLTIAVWTACAGIIIATGPGCATVQRGIERAQEWWDQQRGKDPGKPDSADAVPFSALRWNRGGSNFAGALRDDRVTIRNVQIRAGGTPTLTYQGEGLSIWPAREGNITHVWALFFDESGDGVFARGGKFDWGRSNAAPRPLQHIGGNADQRYQNWDGYPRSGTPVAAVITDATGRLRSNVVLTRWP